MINKQILLCRKIQDIPFHGKYIFSFSQTYNHTIIVSKGWKRIFLNHYYKIFPHVITPTGDTILIKLSSSIFQIYNHKSLFSFRQSCKTRHYTIDKCTIPSICKYLFVKCFTRVFKELIELYVTYSNKINLMKNGLQHRVIFGLTYFITKWNYK